MANGFCQPILSHIEAIAGTNPARKLSPLGFTQAVLSQMDSNIEDAVNEPFKDGHVRPQTVVYRDRALESQVKDTPDCDTVVQPSKKEFTLGTPGYRQIAFWLPDSLIRQYCKDASEYVDLRSGAATLRGNGTAVMREVYETFIDNAGVLLRVMNKDLVTQAATSWGKNLMTGNNNARNLAFALGANGMSDAFVQMMVDLRENEFCNDVTLVGNGPFANLDLIRGWFASGAADNGLDKARMMADLPEVFFDKDTRAIWGENQIGVFEKGSLALMAYDQFVGNFAGHRANSEFFNVNFPVSEFHCPQPYLDRLSMDVQIREIDCPTTLNVNGVNQTVSNGVQVILSKYFKLFVRPANLYDESDPLYGTNGILRYELTSND